MFKKTMTFDDLDGNAVTQTFYFNYNKKEIAELIEFGAIQKFADPNKEYLPLEVALAKLSTPVEESGLSEVENNRQAYAIFENLILDAYGVKGADNVSFDKTPELRNYWSNHLAYVEMIFEFIGNADLASQFIEGCLPGKLVDAAKKEMLEENNGKVSGATLTEMVQEANRRQQDPATRIEPGLENAPEHIQAHAKVLEEPTKGKDLKDLTPEDIMAMDDIAFAKLDPKKLSPEQMLVAFQRKMQR